LLGFAQLSLLRPVKRAAWLTTQFFRNAPWLVLLFYCMFLLPFQITVFGVTIPLPDWVKATLGLALPVMANVGEILRGAMQSIPTAQWESAASLAFTRRQTLWMIILPQCVKRMLPPWMNLYAILTMSTVLASIVGVNEMMTLTRRYPPRIDRDCCFRSTAMCCSGFSSTATRSHAGPSASKPVTRSTSEALL
jgi:polar amino acid transport system permease protein